MYSTVDTEGTTGRIQIQESKHGSFQRTPCTAAASPRSCGSGFGTTRSSWAAWGAAPAGIGVTQRPTARPRRQMGYCAASTRPNCGAWSSSSWSHGPSVRSRSFPSSPSRTYSPTPSSCPGRAGSTRASAATRSPSTPSTIPTRWALHYLSHCVFCLAYCLICLVVFGSLLNLAAYISIPILLRKYL